jgi:hypothetical protein
MAKNNSGIFGVELRKWAHLFRSPAFRNYSYALPLMALLRSSAMITEALFPWSVRWYVFTRGRLPKDFVNRAYREQLQLEEINYER